MNKDMDLKVIINVNVIVFLRLEIYFKKLK